MLERKCNYFFEDTWLPCGEKATHVGSLSKEDGQYFGQCFLCTPHSKLAVTVITLEEYEVLVYEEVVKGC